MVLFAFIELKINLEWVVFLVIILLYDSLV